MFSEIKKKAKKSKPQLTLGMIWYIPFPPLLSESHITFSQYSPSAVTQTEPGLSRSSCFAFLRVNSPLDSKVSLLLKDLLQVSKRRLHISHNSLLLISACWVLFFNSLWLLFIIFHSYLGGLEGTSAFPWCLITSSCFFLNTKENYWVFLPFLNH